jgi:DNA-binding Lrp family transcriptional regulator
MQEGQLLMTQIDRDRLVTLRKAKKKLIKQREAAEELGLSMRQVKRLLYRLKKDGDKAVIHGLRGASSNRRIEEKIQQKAVRILSGENYRGFGPTLASEYLASQHKIVASRETVRKWMTTAGLWKARKEKLERIHEWRPRRSRFGELVQWDTSEHDWLEGRGERLYLIGMIDDATSRAKARFVDSDSTAENMGVLESWVQCHGRMLACYTDKAGLFQTAHKTKRDEQREGKDREPLPPTQIGRALGELNIAWIPAHTPQAKGRIERFFETAQDRLVKGMRLAEVKTIQQANAYLEQHYLPWWNQTCTVVPRSGDDAHRPLEQHHDLAAILSHVETRQVKNDYTVQFDGKIYGIERADISAGLRNAAVRVEQRRDGTVAIRFREKYLCHQLCEPAKPAPKPAAPRPAPRAHAGGKSRWMENFLKTPGPSLKQAISISNATS